MSKDWETTVVEEFGEGLLIILLELEILIQEFLLLLLVLKLQRGVLENLHHNTLGLFLQENITYTE